MFKKILMRKIRKVMRYKIDKNNKSRLKNSNFTIISSNCVGGVISHELGQCFNSPTINMYFNTSDFIKFVNNIDYYLNCDWKDISCDKYNHPVAQIDDIKIYLVHYKTVKEAKQKWDERKKRINYDNIFIIAVERDGCTLKEIKEFDKLPFKNKVIFTKCDMPNLKSTYHIPNTEDGERIIDICKYKSRTTGRRWIDDYDYVRFLNREKNK